MMTTAENDYHEAAQALVYPKKAVESSRILLLSADTIIRHTLLGLPSVNPVRKENRYTPELRAIMRSIEAAGIAVAKASYQIERLVLKDDADGRD